jgi:ABC-type glutathione transport system ATPase component
MSNDMPLNDVAVPVDVRSRLLKFSANRERDVTDETETSRDLKQAEQYIALSDKVESALETLSNNLFQELLGIIEDKMTVALQEVLEQPIQLKADIDWKRNAASVDFHIERDGNTENIMKGQGGSVANILSVGLRLFALTTLDESKHRRFLVLDEQDCWLRPDLVPRLVKIVRDAGSALGFQILMISHHDCANFDRYADRTFRLIQSGSDGVSVVVHDPAPESTDDPLS